MGEALCPCGERQMAPVWFPSSFLSPTSQPGRAGDNPKDTKVVKGPWTGAEDARAGHQGVPRALFLQIPLSALL